MRFPLSLMNLEDLVHEVGVDVSYESVMYWWHSCVSIRAPDQKAQGRWYVIKQLEMAPG